MDFSVLNMLQFGRSMLKSYVSMKLKFERILEFKKLELNVRKNSKTTQRLTNVIFSSLL